MLVDYLDCVLHVFVPELRDRYRLEVLWGEAPRLELGANRFAAARRRETRAVRPAARLASIIARGSLQEVPARLPRARGGRGDRSAQAELDDGGRRLTAPRSGSRSASWSSRPAGGARAGRSGSSELEQVAARLAERVVERERELRELREELARPARAGRRGRAGARRARRRPVEGCARQARGQATRIRMRALRDAAELSGRIGELAERPGRGGRAAHRVARGGDRADRRRLSEERGRRRRTARRSSNGHVEREPGELFEGLIEVEVGPLSDFSQLVGFEDAAAGIGATLGDLGEAVHAGPGDAGDEVQAAVELLRELEERAPRVQGARHARGPHRPRRRRVAERDEPRSGRRIR